MQIGDFVKGLPNKEYGITNEKMTRGIITAIKEDRIQVKVVEHEDDRGGTHWVDPQYFEVTGHVKPFDRGEVLELLKNGCKKAISDYDLSGANLSEADLRGADLSEADLSEADLSEADLRGADLRRADLREADLSEADLSEADLRGADLSEADLSEADLSEADLSEADLSEADLDFSCLPLRCGGLRWKIDKRLAAQLAYHLCSMQCDDAEYIQMRNMLLPFANQFHRVGECGRLEVVGNIHPKLMEARHE